MRRPPAVAHVLERVTATARTHELFLPNETVLLAVSGGPDSMCLLGSMLRLRRLLKVRLEVLHVDHRLRRDSALDARYVRRAADRSRVPFHLHVVAEAPPAGTSLEAWARAQRYWAFQQVARAAGIRTIATGHTRDDQAETVLLRLIAGSGTTGVAAIRPRSGPYVHPLLDVGREEVEAFCRSLRLRPRRDPTNEDPAYALRNALRIEGIPALERALGRNVREPLARAADLLSADDEELWRQARAEMDGIVEEVEEGALLRAATLLGPSIPVRTRVASWALVRCGVMPTRADIDAVLDLAAGRPGRRRDLSGGLKARRDREYVRLTSPDHRRAHGEGP